MENNTDISIEALHHFADKFGLNKAQAVMSPLGEGHINSTYLLTDNNKKLVLQAINTDVFQNPQAMVDNALAIEAHLQQKHLAGDYPLSILKQQPTLEQTHLFEFEGNSWRALAFIEQSETLQLATSPEQAKTAACAFGHFSAALDDFDASALTYVIKDFHNLAFRYQQFDTALTADKQSRAEAASEWVAFCQQQRELINELSEICTELPLTVCHNDTKINNMLFNRELSEAKAIIDLDTCMPGYRMFDFGDMVRTFCSPEAEDSQALDNVTVRLDYFQALYSGYTSALDDKLSALETESLLLGAKVMIFMIGLRFFTDYLDGDNYFGTQYPEHNLHRAKNQFALYQDLLKKETQLKEIINRRL